MHSLNFSVKANLTSLVIVLQKGHFLLFACSLFMNHGVHNSEQNVLVLSSPPFTLVPRTDSQNAGYPSGCGRKAVTFYHCRSLMETQSYVRWA